MTMADAPTLPDPTKAPPSAVVDALVSAGLVASVDADRARDTVSAALGGFPARPAPAQTSGSEAGNETLKGRLAEVLGYVGAVLVVSAAALFVGQQWDRLDLGQRLAFLLVASVISWVAGLAVVRSAGGREAVLAESQDVRRRLASVLVSAGSMTTGGAVVAYLYGDSRSPCRLGAMAYAVVLLLALVGYRWAPSAAGQLTAAGGAAFAVGTVLAGGGSLEGLYIGLGVLAVGLAWLAVAECGFWRELLTGRAVGSVLPFAGAQVALGAYVHDWFAYGLTFLLGVGAFAFYLVRRAWPYLALGVVSLTTAVTEAALDWTDDSLGAAGGMLVAGVALLVSGLLGLRLRREATT